MLQSHLYKYTYNISLLSGFFPFPPSQYVMALDSCERAHGVNAASCATRVSLAALVKLGETGRRQIKPTQVSLWRRRASMLVGLRVFRASGCVIQVSARGMRGMRER